MVDLNKKIMVIRAFKKCDTTTEEGGSETTKYNLKTLITYIRAHPEEEFSP